MRYKIFLPLKGQYVGVEALQLGIKLLLYVRLQESTRHKNKQRQN